MTAPQADVILQHLRTVIAADGSGLTDRELLERLAARREETAFATLVRRHAPLVLGVCRRILRHEQDAEEAFQATFLVLARKAREVGRQGSVSGWLYRVAYHAAIRVRVRSARREQRERQVSPRLAPDPLEEVTGRELFAVLDEELQQLPEDRRLPLVLCYLQGHTCDAAARQLGWSVRTLKRRLEQGRHTLRTRLARHGIVLPAGLLALGLAQNGKAAMPATWATATVRAALAGVAAAGTAPAVADAVLRGLGAARLKAVAALLLLGTLILGAGALSYRAPAQRPDTPVPPAPVLVAAIPKPAPPERPAAENGDAKKTAVSGHVLDADGEPVPGTRVIAYGLVNLGALSRQRQVLALGEAKADAEGRFRLALPETPAGHLAQVELFAGAPGYGPAWQKVSLSGLNAAPRLSDVGPRRDNIPMREIAEAQVRDAKLRLSNVSLRLARERVAVGRLIDLQGQPAAAVKLRPVRVIHSAGRGERPGAPEMTEGQRARLDQAARRSEGFEFSADLPLKDSSLWPATITTDAEGRFRLSSFGRGQEVHLVVDDDRFARQEVIVPSDGKELNVVLLPPRKVTGRVVAADTGKPLAGARVRVTAYLDTRDLNARGEAADGTTDAGGRFTVSAYPGDSLVVEVFPPPGAPYTGTLRLAKWERGAVKQEMEFTLPRGVLVRGTVVEAGGKRPVASASLAVAPHGERGPQPPLAFQLRADHKTYSGADGRFEITVPAGPCHLFVYGPNPDYVYRAVSEQGLLNGKPGGALRHYHAVLPLDLRPQDGPKDITIELRRAVTVKGRVVGPDGKPVPHAELLVPGELAPQPEWQYVQRARSVREETPVGRVAAPDGNFELANCDPQKTYRVVAINVPPLSGPVGSPRSAENLLNSLNRYLGPHRAGAVVDISPAKAAGEPLVVKLVPCVPAEVRLLDAKGKPVPQRFELSLLVTPGPSPANSRQEGKLAAEAMGLAMLPPPLPADIGSPFVADAEGWVRVPSLIPGSSYRIQVLGPRLAVLFEKDFTVKPGKTARLELKLPEAK
jgi:RNA polymerase sigma factor (sigma-70 family)